MITEKQELKLSGWIAKSKLISSFLGFVLIAEGCFLIVSIPTAFVYPDFMWFVVNSIWVTFIVMEVFAIIAIIVKKILVKRMKPKYRHNEPVQDSE